MLSQFRLIEIELFSYCNRKCDWCPNKEIDRTKFYGMEIDIFYNLLNEIKNNNYKGPITFSRYNEPMSYIDLFKTRLEEIKKMLPDNKLITNTNGDFITKENLDGLLIDELTIMDYDQKGIDWCKNKLISVGAEIIKIEKNYIYAQREEMKILYYTNWQDFRVISDRGGFLKDLSSIVRTNECNEPKYFIGINYDGTISPCCNIRNDIENHKEYILGDLHENSLKDILNNNKSLMFRTMCSNGNFREDSPCYRCNNSGGRYTKGGASIDYE